MPYILARLAEPSSYAGVAAMLAAFGYQIPDPVFAGVVQAIGGVAATVAFFLKDRK